MVLVGIDSATDPKKVGIALARRGDEGRWALVAAELGRDRDSLAGRIASWLPASGPALLAIDAPLGWPRALGRALSHHDAGDPLEPAPEQLFARATDRFVRERIGKRPLEVGAERIARTAHASLRLLEDLRERTGLRLPLAWSADGLDEPAAIEVYPAATLAVHGLRSSGYKGQGDREVREGILRGLGERAEIALALEEPLLANADVLDAAVCVLAGCDFLWGRAMPRPDLEEARREGWIWVAAPDVSSAP